MTPIEKYIQDYIDNKSYDEYYDSPKELSINSEGKTTLTVNLKFKPSESAIKNSLLNSKCLHTNVRINDVVFTVDQQCWGDIRSALYILKTGK